MEVRLMKEDGNGGFMVIFGDGLWWVRRNKGGDG